MQVKMFIESNLNSYDFTKHLHTVQLRVLMRATNQEINFLSKRHSTWIKKPLHKQSETASDSKRDVLELGTLLYTIIYYVAFTQWKAAFLDAVCETFCFPI